MLSNNDIVADLAGQLLSLGQPRVVLGHPLAPKVAQTQDLEAERQQRSSTRRLVGNSEGAAWSLLSAPSQLNIRMHHVPLYWQWGAGDDSHETPCREITILPCFHLPATSPPSDVVCRTVRVIAAQHTRFFKTKVVLDQWQQSNEQRLLILSLLEHRWFCLYMPRTAWRQLPSARTHRSLVMRSPLCQDLPWSIVSGPSVCGMLLLDSSQGWYSCEDVNNCGRSIVVSCQSQAIR